MQERADLRSADWTLVGLHAYNLTAVNTEAHVSAREHDRVLCRRVAYNAFLLTLICQISCAIINTVDVVEVHDLVVVEQLLLLVFVPECEALRSGIGRVLRLVYQWPALSCGVLLEVSVGELAILLSSPSIVLRIHRLYLDHYRAEVAFGSEQVEVGRNQLRLQLIDVDNEDLARELLI